MYRVMYLHKVEVWNLIHGGVVYPKRMLMCPSYPARGRLEIHQARRALPTGSYTPTEASHGIGQQAIRSGCTLIAPPLLIENLTPPARVPRLAAGGLWRPFAHTFSFTGPTDTFTAGGGVSGGCLPESAALQDDVPLHFG